MSCLIVRGLDAAGGLEVWKIKAVDILQWSRVLYSAKETTASRPIRRARDPGMARHELERGAVATWWRRTELTRG